MSCGREEGWDLEKEIWGEEGDWEEAEEEEAMGVVVEKGLWA